MTFKCYYQLLFENHLNDSLAHLINDHKSRGVDAHAYINSHGVVLSNLQVEKNAPKGTGTSFMNDLVEWADKNSQILILRTAARGDGKSQVYKTTSSSNRLKEFYKRFGFLDSYGKKSYRPDLGGNMHRHPR